MQTSGSSTTHLESITKHSGGISLWFLRDVDSILQNVAQSQTRIFMIITGCILGVCIIILFSIILRTIQVENHVGLEKVNLVRKWICFILVCFQTFLFMPALDVIVRTIFTESDDPNITDVARYILGAVTLVFLAVLMIYIVRIFNICVPAELIPWCSPISQILFLNLVIKVILVASVATDRTGSFALYEVIILFVMQTF